MDLVRHAWLGAAGLLMVAWIVLAWRRARERRRRWRNELCPECGYDVRGNAERCPECGTPIRRFPRDGTTIVIRDERR